MSRRLLVEFHESTSSMIGLANFCLLLAEGEQPAADPVAGWVNTGTMVVMFAAAYFLLIRPSIRQNREQQDRMSKLKKGDYILTKSGIYGTIYSINKEKQRLILKVDESTNTKIEFSLFAVDNVIDPKTEAETDK